MRSTHLGLRRAGFAGVASALALGGALVAAGPASAAVGEFKAVSQPAVTPGDDQAAGNLTYDFDGEFNTNSTVKFQIAGQTCNTPTQIASAVEFSAAPTVTLTNITPLGIQPVPAVVTSLGSRTVNCTTAGINDEVVVTFPTPAGTPGDDNDFRLTVSGIEYNVGDATSAGPINVEANASGSLDAAAPSTVSNAIVGDKAFSYTGFKAVEHPATDAVLGTATVTGLRATSFADGANVIKFTVSDGATFDTQQPTVATSPGYTKTGPVVFAGDTAAVTVTKTIGATTPLTLTVTGLRVDAPNVAQVEISTDQVADSGVKALNVLEFNDRFGGSDRYATAAKLFATFAPTRDDVVLSSGRGFADALGADYLAQKYDTGLLLTDPKALPTSTRVAITNGEVKRVFITGGPAAVSTAVEAQITALNVGGNSANPKIQVVRIAGEDRYATNDEINRTVAAGADEATVLMASGKDFPDALALGPISYDQKLPLILSNGTSLTARDAAQLTDLGTTRVVIAGGTASVSQAVQDALTARGIAVSRVAGATRYGTATAIATWATEGIGVAGYLSTPLGFTDKVGVATGVSFADALASGPVLGANNAALLLASSANSPSADTTSYLAGKEVGLGNDSVSNLTAIGGADVISSALMNALAASVEE